MKQSISKLFSIKAIIFVCSYLMLLSFTAYGKGNNGDVSSLKPHAVVSSVSPANNATGVAINSSITATFTNKMNPATITTATFTVSTGGSNIAGAVTYSGTTATFTPSSNLSYNTTYTATIDGVKVAEGNAVGLDRALDNVSDKKDKRRVKDSEGDEMLSNYTWTFTTGAVPDITPPTVSSASPTNDTTGVAINSSVTATFSEVMDAATINATTFTIIGVTGTVTYSGTTATFTPSSNLSYSTIYTATITTGVKDAAGNPMATSYTWSFTTGAAPDTTPPTVSSVSPTNDATGVAINSSITATFGEVMDAATITTATVTVSNGGTNIAGAVTYSGTTATFTPSVNLSYSTAYTGTITTGVKDAAGNAMAANYTWTFTTVPISNGTWTTKASMPTARQGATVGSINGAVYVVGGWKNTGGTYATNEAYNTASDTWSTKAAMAAPRSFLGTNNAVVNGILYAIGGNASGYCTNAVEAYDPIANTWSTKASMPTPRCHSAVVAWNGLIYAIGGTNTRGSFRYQTVEIYNTAMNTWSTGANMPTGREGMAAGAVNGVIYVAGGWNGVGSLNTMEAYDIASNTWSTKASMPTTRGNAANGVAANGLLYVIGGLNSNSTAVLSTVEAYNPATNSWSALQPLNTARAFPTVAVDNNTLYAIGGYDGSWTTISAVEAYTLSATTDTTPPTTTASPAGGTYTSAQSVTLACNDGTGTGCGNIYYTTDGSTPTTASTGYSTAISISATTTLKFFAKDLAGNSEAVKTEVYTIDATPPSSMPYARSDAFPGVINGIMYVAGGYNGTDTATLQSYDPQSNSWSSLAPMPAGRYFGASGVINGKLYVAGGWDNTYSWLPHNNLWAYDPTANTWTALANMPTFSGCGTGTVVNGKLYVTTPCNGYSGFSNYLHVYDPSANSWTQLASMPSPHTGGASGAINGKIYLAGGSDGSGNIYSNVDVYDPATNTWSNLASMPAAVKASSSTVIDNRLYVMGGSDSAGVVSTVYIYDPATNTWSSGASLSLARSSMSAGLINGTVYLAGGYNASWSVVSTVEAYTSATTSHTASGTYTYDSGTGVLTMNWTSSDFTCNGPSVGSGNTSTATVTATTMTGVGQDSNNNYFTWARASGTAGDIVGTWTTSDSTTGNSYTLTFNTNGTMSVVGNIIQCGTSGGQQPLDTYAYSGHLMNMDHTTAAYYGYISVYDPNHEVSSVTVSGPSISGSINLSFNAAYNNWYLDSGGVRGMGNQGVNLGVMPPTPPLVYIVTITKTDSTVVTKQATIQGFVDQFASNLSPSGGQSVSTGPVFSWTGVVGGYTYGVHVDEFYGNHVWYGGNVTQTSTTYAGPALTQGTLYAYAVEVRDSNSNFSAWPETFIYGTPSTFTVTPSAGAGGTINPSTPQTVNSGATTTFTVTPNSGYSISSVTGCSGTLSGNTYTTGVITVDCTVTATFQSSPFDGTYTGSWSLTCPICGDTAAGTFSATVTNGAFTSCPTITSGTHGIACFSGTVSSSGSITGTGVAPVQCPNSVSTFTGQITFTSSGGAEMTMQYSRPSDPAGCEAEYGTITATR